MSALDQAAWTESGKFARFALGLKMEDVPTEVLELAKAHLLDALGIAIAASGFEFSKIALEGVRGLGEGTQATAIGSELGCPPASAALLNGILAHGLDFDDTHIGGIYHASSPAPAAVLPAGQANCSTGVEALLAFVASIEMGCRLGVAGERTLTTAAGTPLGWRAPLPRPSPPGGFMEPTRRRWYGRWDCAVARLQAFSRPNRPSTASSISARRKTNRLCPS